MNEEELDNELAGLGSRDLPSARSEAIRRMGHAALGSPTAPRWRWAYHRILEPAFVAALCAMQLAWVFASTASILLPS